MKTPINRNAVRQHFTYAWWKYALLAVLTVFGWNLIYTVTEYQPPADKKIDLFVFSYGENELMNAYMEQVRSTDMTDMEEMSSVFVGVDDTYTPMQLTTYIAAGEGHLYILPKEYFQSYASQGAFMALEDIPGLTDSLAEAGISIDRGWRTPEESDEKHLYGIPLENFPGLSAYIYDTSDLYISITVTNGNDENSIKFLQRFLTDMLEEPIEVDLSTLE